MNVQHCSMPPGGGARRRPCPAITRDVRRATRDCATPPTAEEIIAVMRQTGDDRHGFRLRALIVVLWRGGLGIQEALALGEHDLDRRRGSLLVREGKGGRRRGEAPLRSEPVTEITTTKQVSRPEARATRSSPEAELPSLLRPRER
jgi:integrase